MDSINPSFDSSNQNIFSTNSNFTRWEPGILVLGPGGMKGFLELGCLIPFEKLGILDKMHTMIGTSVGAIIILLYILGYNIEEIIQEGLNVKVEEDFVDFNIENLRARGFFTMNKLTEKITNIVTRKFGYIPSLLKLYELTRVHFIIISSKLPGSEVRLDYKSDPNLSCVSAILFSSTIPFIFTPTEYKGMILYDGALTNPYPVNVLDNGNNNILGMYITADEHVEEGFLWLINTIVRIPMKQLRIVNQNNASDKVKHIELTSPTMDFTGVSSDGDEKNSMIKHGFLTGVNFLKSEGYDTSSLDVDTYIEIPFVIEQNVKNAEQVSEIPSEAEDPNRYIYLYDHSSTDQTGYLEPIPEIDFSLLDPEVTDIIEESLFLDDVENNDDENNSLTNNKLGINTKGNPQEDLQENLTKLIKLVQNYVDNGE